MARLSEVGLIHVIAGARPNFMKVKPVLDALEAVGATAELVHTGQHHDAGMSDVFFEDLGLRKPDHHLGAGSGTHAEMTGRVMVGYEQLTATNRPDTVVVVGDVNSTLACALVATKAGCAVAHVEAGLRSRDWTMPEEANRVVADSLSNWLLAPSDDARVNLLAEGYRPDQIAVVGNVMIDTLLANVERARTRSTLDDLDLGGGRFVLVTLHRPANVDDQTELAELIAALGSLAEDLPVVFPCHPRTRANLGTIPAGVRVLEPLGYLDFICLEASAALVVTDSGGVQEETTVLGVPCLTARDNTERPITITDGTNRLVGRAPTAILAAAREVLQDPPPARRPALWDGKAGERIAAVLLGDPPARR